LDEEGKNKGGSFLEKRMGRKDPSSGGPPEKRSNLVIGGGEPKTGGGGGRGKESHAPARIERDIPHQKDRKKKDWRVRKRRKGNLRVLPDEEKGSHPNPERMREEVAPSRRGGASP